MAKKSLRGEISAVIKNVRSLADLIDDDDGAAYVRDVIRPLQKIRDRLPKAGTAAAVTLAALLSSGCTTADWKYVLTPKCNVQLADDRVTVVDATTGNTVARAWREKDGTACVQTYGARVMPRR